MNTDLIWSSPSTVAIIFMEAILMACDNLSAFTVLSSNDMAGRVLQQTLSAGPDLKVQVTRKQRQRHLRINKIAQCTLT